MDLEDVLEESKRFILERLNAQAGTLTAKSAIYDDDSETWTIGYDYVSLKTGKWVNVTIEIDNDSEEIFSFKVNDQ